MWPWRRDRRSAIARDPARLGQFGEKIARKHLRKAGLKILAQNFRCAAGEADLIAMDPHERCLVFVEVKTRTDDTYVDPESAVDSARQRRYGRIAQHYLQCRDTAEWAVRFDVVAVLVPPSGPTQVRHIPHAFQPSV